VCLVCLVYCHVLPIALPIASLTKMIRGVQVCTIIQVLETRCISLYLPVLSSSRRFTVFYGGYGISHDFTVLTNSRQWLYVVPRCCLFCHTQAIQPVQVDGRFCSPTPLWPYVLHECQRVSLIVDSHILRTSLFATYQCLSYCHVLIAPSEIPSGIPFQTYYTVCVYVHIYIHTHAQEDIINSRYNVYIHTTPYYYIPFHFHSILFPFHSMSISLHYIIILHHYYDHNNDNHI
jgi:hypothetical protein